MNHLMMQCQALLCVMRHVHVRLSILSYSSNWTTAHCYMGEIWDLAAERQIVKKGKYIFALKAPFPNRFIARTTNSRVIASVTSTSAV